MSSQYEQAEALNTKLLYVAKGDKRWSNRYESYKYKASIVFNLNMQLSMVMMVTSGEDSVDGCVNIVLTQNGLC